MLVEKPSHNTAEDAEEFAARIEERGLTNRFVVGMHEGLHPSRGKLLEMVRVYKDEIVSISALCNHPKDPHCPTSWRTYHASFGGTMLDLGIYPIKLAKEVGEILGFDLHNFKKDKKRIRMKRYENGVDMEM